MSQDEDQFLSHHVWNGNLLAISKTNCSLIYIYEIPQYFNPFGEESFNVSETDYSKWDCKYILDATLNDEDAETVVNEIKFDWNQETNTIVSCSSNSIGKMCKLWKMKEIQQNPETKSIRILTRSRSPCLFCKWTKDGSKFAVGSHQTLATCHFEDDTQFGFSKLKKLNDTATAAAWHPDCVTVACVDISNILLIYCASKWNEVKTKGRYGTVFMKKKLENKVNHLEFSPDGLWLAVLSSNSSISFYKYSNEDKSEEKEYPKQDILHSGLAFSCGIFLSNKYFVAAGYDNAPFLFELENETAEWKLKGKLINERGIYHTKHIHSLQLFQVQSHQITFTTASYDNSILFWRIKL